MKILSPDGKLFETQADDILGRNAAEKLVEIERHAQQPSGRLPPWKREIAATERQRAESALQRADRLAAKLRELGIEPDGA